MIYNLAKYLMLQFPTETIYTNQKHKILTDSTIADRIVILTESGGPVQAKTGWVGPRVQFYFRDVDSVVCRELAKSFYNYINDRNGCELPANTVNGVVYPAVKIAQMIAEQTPSHINTDDQGRPEMVFNLKIQYTEV